MAEQFFLVPDRVGRYHEAKTLVDAAGNDVINPNIGAPFVVPRNFNINTGIAFGMSLDPTSIYSTDVGTGQFASIDLRVVAWISVRLHLAKQRLHVTVVATVKSKKKALRRCYDIVGRSDGLIEVPARRAMSSLKSHK